MMIKRFIDGIVRKGESKKAFPFLGSRIVLIMVLIVLPGCQAAAETPPCETPIPRLRAQDDWLTRGGSRSRSYRLVPFD